MLSSCDGVKNVPSRPVLGRHLVSSMMCPQSFYDLVLKYGVMARKWKLRRKYAQVTVRKLVKTIHVIIK
jgi:hypothetical protein